MKKLLNLLLLCVIGNHFTIGQTGKYPIKNYTTETYQAGIQNIDFAQNGDKSIFVANNLGVLSYNGEEWKTFRNRTGKKQRSLAYDQHQERLYVGSQREFGYFDKTWNYHSLIPTLDSFPEFDEVWDVYIINSLVYFCTFQAIFIYDGKTVKYITHPDGMYRTFKVHNKIITQAKNGLLYEVLDEKLQPSKLTSNVSQIAGLIQHDEETLIFYNSGKVVKNSILNHQTSSDAISNALSGTYVNHVKLLSDSRIAISTQTSGIYLYNLVDGTIDKITTREGLQSNACLRTFQDYNGNLWVGMQNGLAQIHLNIPVRFFNQEIGIQGSGYEVFDAEEGIYFTTSNGAYFHSNGDKNAVPIEGTEGPSYSIVQIDDKLYACHHTGLFLLNEKKAKLIAKTNGLWNIKILESNPKYLIGGGYDGLYLFTFDNNNTIKLLRKVEGFYESSRFFEEDDSGNIIVSQYYKGLFQLFWNSNYSNVNTKTLIEITPESQFTNIIVEKIDNELYIGTDLGVFILDENSDSYLSKDHPLSEIGEEEVFLLKEDAYKNVFYITDNAVGYLERISNKNYKKKMSSVYNYRYYFNNDLLHVSHHQKTGIMLTANTGFIHYNPKEDIRIVDYTVPIIHKVVSVTKNKTLYENSDFGSKQDSRLNLDIREQDRVIRFYTSPFQFQNMYDQEYQYFLEGFDEKYSDWVSYNTKEYSNLKTGEYKLHVRTKNHFGQIIEAIPFSIKIIPPFYKSLAAKITYSALGFLLLGRLFMIREKRHKTKALKLRDEKAKAINQLEKEKDVVLHKAKEEKIQTELRHVNNLLAASTMNLVVKNEFIDTIKRRIKEIRGTPGNKKSALDQIVKDIDSTLKLQEDWEQFEFHFDKVHGEFLKRLREKYANLSPNEQKLCALLRLNLNTKEIANLLGISTRGVEVARYRLRKKLDLEPKENLSKFILEY